MKITSFLSNPSATPTALEVAVRFIASITILPLAVIIASSGFNDRSTMGLVVAYFSLIGGFLISAALFVSFARALSRWMTDLSNRTGQ